MYKLIKYILLTNQLYLIQIEPSFLNLRSKAKQTVNLFCVTNARLLIHS